MNLYEAFLKKQGMSLNTPGNSDVALKRCDALRAIELLQEESAVILGGDVYFLDGGKGVPAYANWYVDPNQGESTEAYRLRTYQIASNYVKEFPVLDRQIGFVLVIQS